MLVQAVQLGLLVGGLVIAGAAGGANAWSRHDDEHAPALVATRDALRAAAAERTAAGEAPQFQQPPCFGKPAQRDEEEPWRPRWQHLAPWLPQGDNPCGGKPKAA